ncbi:MAG: hypothetical protein OXH92_01795, partial [Bryobacterales bacterium]|nr:hypothetical protein [Bryobacterales bacterium]
MSSPPTAGDGRSGRPKRRKPRLDGGCRGGCRLTCISHHQTVEARHTAARTSLRLLAVLNVLFKYA